MREGRRRRNSVKRGIASIIGTMLFVLVLMMAIGAQVYVAGLQAQSGQSFQQALQVADLRGSEKLSFASPQSGVTVLSSGAVSAKLVLMVLKYGNGTAFNLSVSTSIPSGSTIALLPLVPSGNCGSMTCARRYSAITTGSASGMVGLVTSFGNTFWYVPSQSGGIGSSTTYWTTSAQSTTSSSFVPVSGLSFTAAQNSKYQISVFLSYYQSSATSPGMNFGVSVQSGATLLACGGIVYPDSPNRCTTTPNSAVGSTIFSGDSVVSPNLCNTSSSPCVFTATILVSEGSNSGTFQIEYEASPSTTGTVVANSIISVAQS